LEQAPVGFRQALEEFAHFEVIARHGADTRHQFPADVFSHGFLVDFGRQVIPTLRRILVQRSLQQIQSLVDLTLELLLPEMEQLGFFAHVYTYEYIYLKTPNPKNQAVKGRN